MNEANVIKKKLQAWGIKQQWLADKMGISKTLLSLWLSGTYDMPTHRIEEAKKHLDKIPMPKE